LEPWSLGAAVVHLHAGYAEPAAGDQRPRGAGGPAAAGPAHPPGDRRAHWTVQADRLSAAHPATRGRGLVVLDGIREGGPGRTAELYRIDPDAGHVAAIEVRRAQIRACVADLAGTVTGRFELPTPGSSGGDAVARARTAVEGAMDAAGLQTIDRVVIGVPGAVDPRTERLGYASHLPGRHIPDLLSRLRAGLGVPVAVENDVNLV
jgi:hypothetical protein